MPGSLASFALTFLLLQLQLKVTALPRPQVAGAGDASTVAGGTSTGPGVAQAFPNAGQDAGQGDASTGSSAVPAAAAATSTLPAPPAAATTSTVPAPQNGQSSALTADDGSTGSTPSNQQSAGSSNNLGVATPLTPDTSPSTSDNTPSSSDNTPSTPATIPLTPDATPLTPDTTSSNAPVANAAAAPAAPQGTPGELTGQLLGMPDCKGTYYNPQWDSCDQATGALTSKAGANKRRNDSGLSLLSKKRDSRRQVSGNVATSSVPVQNPAVLNGQYGSDDGAVPHKESLPPARALFNKRQVTNESHSHASSSNDPTGYLAGIGASQVAEANAATDAILPKPGMSRRRASLADFDSNAPHRDGNNVEVGPPGPGGARNIIINRRLARSSRRDASANVQSRGSVHENADGKLVVTQNKRNHDDSSMDKRGVVRENPDGKLVVTQNKRQNGDIALNKRGSVREDADGKLVVTQSKRDNVSRASNQRGRVTEDADGKLVVSQAKRHGIERQKSMVKRDDMTRYHHDIPKQEKRYVFGPDDESEPGRSASGGDRVWWWGV